MNPTSLRVVNLSLNCQKSWNKGDPGDGSRSGEAERFLGAPLSLPSGPCKCLCCSPWEKWGPVGTLTIFLRLNSSGRSPSMPRCARSFPTLVPTRPPGAAWLGLPLGAAPRLRPSAPCGHQRHRHAEIPEVPPAGPGSRRQSLPFTLHAGLSRPPTSPLPSPSPPTPGDPTTNPSPQAPQQLSPTTQLFPSRADKRTEGRKLTELQSKKSASKLPGFNFSF